MALYVKQRNNIKKIQNVVTDTKTIIACIHQLKTNSEENKATLPSAAIFEQFATVLALAVSTLKGAASIIAQPPEAETSLPTTVEKELEAAVDQYDKAPSASLTQLNTLANTVEKSLSQFDNKLKELEAELESMKKRHQELFGNPSSSSSKMDTMDSFLKESKTVGTPQKNALTTILLTKLSKINVDFSTEFDEQFEKFFPNEKPQDKKKRLSHIYSAKNITGRGSTSVRH